MIYIRGYKLQCQWIRGRWVVYWNHTFHSIGITFLLGTDEVQTTFSSFPSCDRQARSSPNYLSIFHGHTAKQYFPVSLTVKMPWDWVLANGMWVEMIHLRSWPIKNPQAEFYLCSHLPGEKEGFQEPIHTKLECAYPLTQKSHFKKAILQKPWHTYTSSHLYEHSLQHCLL